MTRALERSTKLIVLLWACLAAAVEVWLMPGWRQLPLIAAGLGAAALILAGLSRKAVGLVLVFTCIFPAVVYLLHGSYTATFAILWMIPMLGFMTPDAVRSPWQIPDRWRAYVVCWGLTIVVAASIAAVREIDFNSLLLLESRMPSSILNASPRHVFIWILHVALVLVVGILWFDWLCGAIRRGLDFHAYVATPLMISIFIMMAVALYQMFVDIWFLNSTVYGVTGRASGTLFDANVTGTIAAVSVGAVVLWAASFGRFARPVAVIGVLAAWLAVWATGSRLAFAAAAFVTGFVLAALFRSMTRVGKTTALWSLALAFVLLVGGLVVLARADLQPVGPLRRIRATAPALTIQSIQQFVIDLAWVRDNYGLAANAVIRKFPWFGIGPGCFHQFAGDYIPNGPLPPDNAQNWFRHQLAEFGIVGSLGWIGWVVSFGAFVVHRTFVRPADYRVTVAGGALLAFVLISLVGMPGQEVSAAFLFWTMAFWCVVVGGIPASVAGVSRREWSAIAAVLLVFAIGTTVTAVGALRPPVRYQQLGRAYSYGFYAPESDTQGREFRWARQRAAIVLEGSRSWLVVRVGADYGAFQMRPLNVKVWRDRELILDARLEGSEPITVAAAVPSGERHVLLETWTSRVLRPMDIGVPDRRELGVKVAWAFTDAPPAEASRVIN